MRLLEIILLLALLPAILWPLVGKPRPRWVLRLILTAVPLTLLQILIEGYRWQMVPAYVLTAVITLLSVRDWGATAVGSSKKRVISGILLGILWLLALILPILLPVPVVPTPTGDYAVGTTSYHLIDDSRDEFYTDEIGDKREIMVQLWYPASDVAGLETAPFITNLDIAAPILAERLGLPSFLLDHINLVKTHAYLDAPVDEGTFPVLIFSHGLAGIRQQNSTLMEELASQGYVVASIDHTYGNLLTIFPDDRIAFYEPAIFGDESANPPRNATTLMKVWAEDAAFTLDTLTKWTEESGGIWNDRLDLSKVGMLGHSTGGGTAVEFCRTDDRCQAALGLDAWVEPIVAEALQTGVQRPLFLMHADVWQFEDPITNVKQTQALYESLDNGYLLTVNGAAHFDFTDIPLFSPLTPYLDLSSTLPSDELVHIINTYTLAFFDETLRGQPDPLLQEDPAYPYLEFER